jgi:hypothetical protein
MPRGHNVQQMSGLYLLSSAARGFMGERTFNEVWVESDGDDEVTGPARASPLALGTPSGVNDALHASMQQLHDLGPGGDTPSGDHMHGHAFQRLGLTACHATCNDVGALDESRVPDT